MANELERMDPNTGEIMTMTESAQPLAVQMAQAELNQAVTTAKAFPRSVKRVVNTIMELATIDEETAEESVYALPRGGKPIRGPSIRFAEIVASQWGNCHTGSRIVAVDRFEKVVIAEGVFLDLETGMKRTAQIRRKISDKHGRIFNDDMITVTGNAAASIAMREAILKGIPKAVWRRAYEHCERVLAGDVATLNVRREKATAAFAAWGVKPEQIFAALEIEGIDNIGLDEIATLTAMHKAIKSGEQKVEDYFPAHSDGAKATEAAKGTAAKLGKIAEQGKPTGGGKPAAKAENKQEARAANEPGGKAKGEGEGEADRGAGGEARPGTDAGEDAGGAEDAGGGDGGGSDGAGDAEGGEASEAFTDQQFEEAFQRGAEAKRKGMSRKALPGEWRAEGFEPLADAWVRGFTETEA